jgi:chromosome segregation ATPase
MDYAPAASPTASRRAAAESKKAYDRLHKSYKKLAAKHEAHQDELRTLRAEKGKSVSSLATLSRQCERLKEQSAMAAAETRAAKDTTRRIEQKLAGGTGGQYLAEKYKALRERARALKQRSEEQAVTISSQESSLIKAANQIDILARALEVRVQELGLRQPGPRRDAKESLIYEVAMQRNEMQRLAGELAQQSAQTEELRAKLAEAQADAADMTSHKALGEAQAADTARSLEAALAKIEEQSQEMAKMGTDRDVMIDYIKEMQDKMTTQENQANDTESRTTKEIMDLKLAINTAQSEATLLRQQLSVFEERVAKLTKVQQLTEGRMASEHAEMMSTQADMLAKEKQAKVARNEAAQLREQLASAEAELAELRLEAERTNAARTSTEKAAAAERVLVLELETRIAEVESSSVKEREKYQREMQKVLQELENSVQDKGRINVEMGRAAASLAALREENLSLRAKLVAASPPRSTRDGMGDAARISLPEDNAGLIQKTLLEQISKLRARVRQLESGKDRDTIAAGFGGMHSRRSVSPLTVDQANHSPVSARRSPGRGGGTNRSPSHVHVHRSGSISINSSRIGAYQSRSNNPLSPSLIDLASNPLW